jgi:hypothetical protein
MHPLFPAYRDPAVRQRPRHCADVEERQGDPSTSTSCRIVEGASSGVTRRYDGNPAGSVSLIILRYVANSSGRRMLHPDG